MTGILAVRKTLVLGLGSTGMQVCEQLAEHLNWQYGSFERAAWVRLLVVETAQPQTMLGDRVLWAGMPKEEYLPYLNSPRTTGAEFGFYDWQDGPTLRDIDNPSDGAGNCRMLGRLCLFHPRTYQTLHRRVTTDISELQQLTPQKVADALGDSGMTVRIDEGGVVVYVVGTLCGGTGSGGAADLGYLMDVWSNHSVRRQAIFTIPHPTLQNSLASRYKKNAFYALKELNHYQLSDTTWKQLLPGSYSPFVNQGRPYDILRVVMPAGGAGGDVKSLNAMIGQYLAAAVGPAGLEIAASDVDATAQMVGAERIGFMRPLFSTMGIAALEFPGEHVQRAASSRLLATTFARWSGHRSDTTDFQSALGTLGGTDFDTLLLRLQKGADDMSTRLFQDLFKPLAEGNAPAVQKVRQILRDVDARLTATELPTEPVPGALPSLAQLIQANHDRFLETIAKDVDRFVQERLFRVDGGPSFVAALLRKYLAEMEAWAEKGHATLPEARQDTESLRSMLDREIDEVEKLEKNPLVWNKRDKLREAWDEVTKQLYSYLQAELKTQTISQVQRRDLVPQMVDQYRRVTALLLRRLDQIQAAFNQEAAEQERLWKELAAISPGVNGKVYFESEPPAARGTVTEEYYKLLRQPRYADESAGGWDDSKKEEAAMREVLNALAPLSAELTREDGRSAFDPRPGAQSVRESIPAIPLRAAEARARALFTPLRDQVHIADKATDTDIDTVIQASEPKLSVSAAQVSEQLAGAKGANPMLSYLAFMDTGSGEGSRPSVARVEQRVRNSMPLRRGGVTDSDDPFRLLVIREKHGFTLGQMEGVVRTGRYDNHALQSAEGCMDFKFWQTRRDVDWVDPLIPPGQVDSTEEAWLTAILLGRPADTSLPWLPSSKGEIPA
ncbi:MAG: tubulin-like doman-containing protein, partial [Actinomycetota bacterium]